MPQTFSAKDRTGNDPCATGRAAPGPCDPGHRAFPALQEVIRAMAFMSVESGMGMYL